MGAQDHVAAMLFERARENHLAGRLQEAEPLYRHALRLMPDHAETLHMLGVLLMQMGFFAPAADLIGQAVRLRPEMAHYLGSLGAALRQLGRGEDALACFARAVELRPDFADGFCKIGMIQRALGRPGEAVEAYHKALRVKPDLYDAHNNLGNALRDLGRLDEAEHHLSEALRLSPHLPEAHNNLAGVLTDLGRPAEAEERYHEALRLDPDYAEARFNLGVLFRRGGKGELAEAQYREAVRCRPGYLPALSELAGLMEEDGRILEAEPLRRQVLAADPLAPAANAQMGGVLTQMGAFDEAEQCLRVALESDPGDLQSLLNMAVAQSNLGRPAEAERHSLELLRRAPDHAAARQNYAMALLSSGRYAEGWEEYEWRWRSSLSPRNFSEPLWTGEPMEEGALLLHAEQGLGDTVQFCRYVPAAAGRARIILEVQPPLVRLLSQLPGIARVVAAGEPLPRFDRHCPLLSLPRLFGTTLETIPADISYLRADPAAAARWRTRLAGLDGLRVGLVWAGNPSQELTANRLMDSRRSIGLARLAPLARLPGISFVSLQKGAHEARMGGVPPGLELHDWTSELGDFADTAALVDGLDLVITVDTSMAHLAGALGKRVWMMNRFDSCWRWLRDRDDSPWYPTLRQFRQPRLGDWDSVVAAVRAALVDWVCNRLVRETSPS